jgi:hypothetical protein
MFVMASPLEAHLTETLTSLKFATKVRLIDPFQESKLTPSRYITHILAQQRSQRKFVSAAVISSFARGVAWYRESNIWLAFQALRILQSGMDLQLLKSANGVCLATQATG